jgi:hypothetical protein
MTSNLVPQVITDKNGVTTTRWVKPTGNSSVAQSALRSLPPIPAVPQLQHVSRVSLLGGLYKAFSEYGEYENWENLDFDGITAKLKGMDDHSLRLVTNFIQKDNQIAHAKVTEMVDLLDTYADQPTYLNELLTYHDAFSNGTDQQFREEAVQKLHKCAEIPKMNDYSLAKAETQAEIRRLLKSAEDHYAEYYEPDDNQNIILGEGMRKFIADNPDQLDRIDEIMIERQTEDPEVVNSKLNSETPSISSGIL